MSGNTEDFGRKVKFRENHIPLRQPNQKTVGLQISEFAYHALVGHETQSDK